MPCFLASSADMQAELVVKAILFTTGPRSSRKAMYHRAMYYTKQNITVKSLYEGRLAMSIFACLSSRKG